MLEATDLQNPWPVVARAGERVEIIVVGAGGTGSQLVPHLARLVWDFNQQQGEHGAGAKRGASLLIVDHDIVAEKNVRARQNFCPPEVGYPKAQVLANRYGIAFGMHKDEIGAKVAPFTPEVLQRRYSDLIILVGCVDTAEARASIAACLKPNYQAAPRTWYVDAGNGFHWGQVFVGNTATIEDLRGCLHDPICARLPSPALLAPSMFEVPEEAEAAASSTLQLSCGDLVLSEQEGNRQSRTINTHMAALVYAYVEQLIYGSITTFATYTNLPTFETHSVSVTPGQLGRALGVPPEFFTMHPDDEDEGHEEEDGDEYEEGDEE
jgi:PRTRC genetic system ThiF family protein